MKIIIVTFILIFGLFNFLFSEEYFLTLRNNTVNLRQGPSFDYSVKIFYKKKNYFLDHLFLQSIIQPVFLVSLIFLKFKLSVLKTIIFPTNSFFLFKIVFTISLA